MRHQYVTVTFGDEGEFQFKPTDAITDDARAEARAWFDREFVALECDLASPIGKVLSADRVLNVAKYAGAKRFRDDPAWADAYARHAAALLGRDMIRVDVPNFTLGF